MTDSIIVAATVILLAVFCAAWFGFIPWFSGWVIGPVTRLRNRSKGLPFRPVPDGYGWHFYFPHPTKSAGHVHYVQNFDVGDLWGVDAIRLRYRVEAADDVLFCPQERPLQEASVSLMIQRKWDTWTGKGRFEHYRWFRRIGELKAGTFDVTIPMRDWISIYGKRSSSFLEQFNDALKNTSNLSIIFGGPSGLGHGVYATGPARFTLESLELVKE